MICDIDIHKGHSLFVANYRIYLKSQSSVPEKRNVVVMILCTDSDTSHKFDKVMGSFMEYVATWWHNLNVHDRVMLCVRIQQITLELLIVNPEIITPVSDFCQSTSKQK